MVTILTTFLLAHSCVAQSLNHGARHHSQAPESCETGSCDIKNGGGEEDLAVLLQGRLTSSRDAGISIRHNATWGVAPILSILQDHIAQARYFDTEIVPTVGHSSSIQHREVPALTPEDLGIAKLSSILLHLSPHVWIILNFILFLGLAWTVPRQIATQHEKEDETMFQNAHFAVVWVSLGIIVILFNKCLFMEAGSGFNFPYPILLNWFHMFCTALFTHTIRLARPNIMPSMQTLTVPSYFYGVVPIACMLMIGLTLSNMAYLYISVSYIQMVKNTTSAFVFIFSILRGFEQLEGHKGTAVALVIGGMMMSTGGDSYFNMVGFILQISATMADACRIVLTKTVMSSKYSVKLDPLSACCVTSSSVCVILTIPMLLTDFKHATFAMIWDLRLVLCANALLVIGLNMSGMLFMKKVGPTTYALTGVLKDVILVLSLLALFNPSAVVGLEGLGFVISVGGLTYYNIRVSSSANKS